MKNRWWAFMIIGSALSLGILVLSGLQSPLRVLLAFWFLLVCPGMAFVRLLHIGNPIIRWTLAIALSLAIGAVIAGAMLYLRSWSADAGLVMVILIALVGAALLLGDPDPQVMGDPEVDF